MPGKKKPGPSVKDDKMYEAIRDQGGSKEKAARIANASAARSRSSVGKKGGKARAEALTSKQRADIARKAAAARWNTKQD